MENIAKIFEFIDAINKLKFEARYSGVHRHDTTASHSWRMTVLTYRVAQELDIGLDIDKCVRMSLVHDLPEAVAGDLDYKNACLDPDKVAAKEKSERAGIKKLTALLPKHLGDEIYNLCMEYIDSSTPEARFSKIMDKLENGTHAIFMGYETFDEDRLNSCEPHTRKGFGWFPEVDKVINFVREKQKAEFIKHGFEWKPEWDLKS